MEYLYCYAAIIAYETIFIRREVRSLKRSDYITWDEYFMGIALLSAQRSKDSNTQVGACIVNSENKIVSVGYNGMPTGCSDDEMPWERSAESALDTKYPFVCHAELNAILNSNIPSLAGATLYVTLFPCNECAKAIIQCGIKRVVYLDNKYADTNEVKASAMMFGKCGIETQKYEPSGRTLSVDL
jgi:Deoxycytidylate deaminase